MAGIRFLGGINAGGPPPLPPLPGIGKDGWLHRYNTASIASGVGSAVSIWADAAVVPFKDDLLRVVVDSGVGTPEPLLMEESGVQFVRFAGIDLQSSTAVAEPRSFAVLLRSPVQQGLVVQRIAGAGISRISTVSPYVYRTNPGGVSILGHANAGTSSWMCIVGSLDASGPTIRYNAVEVAGPSYTPPTTVALTSTQHPIVSTVAPASPTQPAGTYYVDVVEQVVWPVFLDATDRASVYAAFKANYPTLGLP